MNIELTRKEAELTAVALATLADTGILTQEHQTRVISIVGRINLALADPFDGSVA